MLNPLDSFYSAKPPEEQELLLYLRSFILAVSQDITEHYKFNTAFFYLKGKMFCYFGQEKKSHQVYIGFVDGKHLQHTSLVHGNRKQIKVLPIQIKADINQEELSAVFEEALRVGLILQNFERPDKPIRIA